MSEFNSFIGLDHLVLLGCDAVQSGVLLFDFDKDRLALLKEFTKPAQGEWRSIEISRKLSTPRIMQSIGEESISFLLDTGSSGSFRIPLDQFDALVERGFIKEGESAKTITVSGLTRPRSGKFSKGVLLGLPLEGFEVNASEQEGKLGMEFLCHFNFAIDFPKSRFHFDLREAFTPLEVNRTLGAIFTFEDDGAVVYDVRPANLGNSPAGAAGLEKGDKITSFGALQGKEMNIESVYLYVREHSHGEIPVKIFRAKLGESMERVLVLE